MLKYEILFYFYSRFYRKESFKDKVFAPCCYYPKDQKSTAYHAFRDRATEIECQFSQTTCVTEFIIFQNLFECTTKEIHSITKGKE